MGYLAGCCSGHIIIISFSMGKPKHSYRYMHATVHPLFKTLNTARSPCCVCLKAAKKGATQFSISPTMHQGFHPWSNPVFVVLPLSIVGVPFVIHRVCIDGFLPILL